MIRTIRREVQGFYDKDALHQAMEVGDVIEIEVEGGQANVKSFAN